MSPVIRKLDFSEFHDLMHYPFSLYCWRMPGGWARHVALWWEYKATPYIMAHTACRLGHHHWCESFRGDEPLPDMCWHCGRTR